jgi:hypothetical protein
MNIVKWNPFREFEDIQTRLTRIFSGVSLRRTDADGLFFADWTRRLRVSRERASHTLRYE